MKKGFSYAEAMVTMLIVAIIMLATTPIITKKAKISKDSIWGWATGNTISTFFGTGTKQRVIIGAQNDDEQTAKVVIYKANDTRASASQTLPPILRFKDGSDEIGRLITTANSLGLGVNALNSMKDTSANSTAIGANALKNATGTGNTAIGYNACQKITGGSNNICIGASPTENVSNALYIGSLITGSGNMTNGEESVTINGNTILGRITTTTDEATSKTTTTYPNTLTVNGAATFSTDLNLASELSASVNWDGNKYQKSVLSQLANNIAWLYTNKADVTSSDARLKNIQGVSTAGLAQINKIVVKNFTFKNDKQKRPQVGVIAQELMKIFPNSVKKGNDGYFKIRTDEMFYAMINAIKELDVKFNKHDKEMQAMKQEIETLRQENQALSQKITEIEQKLTKK